MSTDEQTTVVTSILGEQREAKLYPDGGWNCPFCGGAVSPDDPERDGRCCGNPACPAGRYATVEAAEEQQRRQQRQADLDRRHESMRRYLAESRRREAEERERRLVEAREHGYCPVCILGYHGKKVRHRRPENCPRPREVIVGA